MGTAEAVTQFTVKLLVLYLDDFARIDMFELLAAAIRALIRERINRSIPLARGHELTTRPAHHGEHAFSRLLVRATGQQPLVTHGVASIPDSIPG